MRAGKKKPERGRKIMKIGDGAAVATVRGYMGVAVAGSKRGKTWQNKKDLAKNKKSMRARDGGLRVN